MKRLFTLLLSFLLLGNFILFAQGVTDANLEGKVSDNSGEGIPGAAVILTHIPTGTEYTMMSSEDGYYVFPNVKVGGPYKLEVKYIGYSDVSQEDIYLSLNQTLKLPITMYLETENIEEVEIVYERGDDMNSGKTGSVTFVDNKQIEIMPTITGSQADLTRLTPESNGNSFGGRNNLYNNFSLDGSIFNNSFGLDYATPGGQADAQPVSIEAIDQMQISLAPFNVTEGGFTGAGVNAVTKSGTNELKIMLYEYFRNESFIGSKVGDADAPNYDYLNNRFGINIGGPIIKNKLFFFVNYEGVRQDRLAHGFIADDGVSTGDNVTTVSEADAMAVQSHLRNEWGYEPGAYDGYNHEKKNDKLLAKIDWNVSKKTKIRLRYNYLNAFNDILPHPEAIGGRGATGFRLPFENSSYNINNKIHSIVGEVNTLFSNKISNNILVGYTAFRDRREPFSEPFPVVDVLNSNGLIALTAGSEMFSTHNRLYQDVYQFTDNLNIYMNKHTFTVGINYEQFNFDNSFNLFYYPAHTFLTVEDFQNNQAWNSFGEFYYTVDLNQDVTNSQVNEYSWAYVDVGQFGIYAQDKYKINDQLDITLGLRVDLPIYLSEIEPDPETVNFTGWVDEDENSATVDPSKFPGANFLWSPRFGFNYDVTGENKIRIRGGSGIFSGRIPFVWLGNQASNPRIDPGYEFQVNATSEDFKFPQTWKSNLAIDFDAGDGWRLMAEGIFSKDINAVVHRNYNMRAPSGTLDYGPDPRPIYQGDESNIYSHAVGFSTLLEAGAIVLDNTKEGYQMTLTGKLTKQFDFGLNFLAAYTYTESKDYTSIPAEIAADAFQRNPIYENANFPVFSYSRYGLKHRIISAISYSVEYGNMATTLSFFYEGGIGNRFSYTYAGDINLDQISNNDLIYIPNSSDEMNWGTVDSETGIATVASDGDVQRNAFEAFIDQDPYLKEHRGEIAERHGPILPWFNTVDFRLMQDFSMEFGGKKHTIQVLFDIMNIGNLINSNWGVRQLATTWNPISVAVDNNSVPYFSFDTDLTESYIDDVSTMSKWQMQIGVRYYFNK
jgi:hypothetical protein